MGFKLGIDYQGHIPIVRVTGDVDIYTAPLLDNCLNRLVMDGNKNLALDLKDCTYFDSEGIKALIRAMNFAGEGWHLAICGAHGSVARVFEVSGLDKLFRILPSTDDLRE